jgi:hypothetical protein
MPSCAPSSLPTTVAPRLCWRRILPGRRPDSSVESLALAEKFNDDLRRRVLDSRSNLFDSVGQFVRVDIYSYATTRTGHVLLHFELGYRLFEVISAAWALKLNLGRVNVSHLGSAS